MKHRCSKQKSKLGEYGVGLILGLIVTVLILCVGAFAINAAYLYRSQVRLQRAVDAGALAGMNLSLSDYLGAMGPSASSNPMFDAAKTMVCQNLAASKFQKSEYDCDKDIHIDAPLNSSDPSVTVTASVHPQCFLLSFLPGCAQNGGSVTATAVAKLRVPIISFVIDISDSMKNSLDSNPNNTKIKALHDALQNIFNNLSKRAMVSLTVFSTYDSVAVPMNDIAPAWTDAQITAQRQSLKDAVSQMTDISGTGTLKPQGNTNTSGGVYRGWEAMMGMAQKYPAAPKYLVLFTDGAPNLSTANWLHPVPNTHGYGSLPSNPSSSLAPAQRPWYYVANQPKNYWMQTVGGNYLECRPNSKNNSLHYCTTDPSEQAIEGDPSMVEYGGTNNPHTVSLWLAFDGKTNPDFSQTKGDGGSESNVRHCWRGGYDKNVSSDPWKDQFTRMLAADTTYDAMHSSPYLTNLFMYCFRTSPENQTGPMPNPTPNLSLPVGQRVGLFEFTDPSGRIYSPGYEVPWKEFALDYSWSKVAYATAIAAADWVRRQNVTVDVVAIGAPDSGSPSPQSFFQTIGDSDLRKDFMLNRLANDSTSGIPHVDFDCHVGDTDTTCPKPPGGIDHYSELNGPSTPHGVYIPVQPSELTSAFQTILKQVRLQLTQ